MANKKNILIEFEVTKGKFHTSDENFEECMSCNDVPNSRECFYLSSNDKDSDVSVIYLQLCPSCFKALKPKRNK